MKKYTFKLFLLFALFGSSAFAQYFNYSVSIDTSVSYTPLNDAVILSSNQKWIDKYIVPTGFADSAIQQVSIETNGFIVYNQKFNSAIMAFKGFNCKLDSASAFSQLSYLTTGIGGSQILKIEYKNVGRTPDPKELLNYQVWFHETGEFDILIGSHTYEVETDSISDSSLVYTLGLINRNMDTETNGLFLSGTPSNPVSTPLNSESPDLAFLRYMPKRGFRYTFTPNQH